MEPDQLIELTSPFDVEPILDEWRALVARTGGSYFQLPDWVMSWWQTAGERPPTSIAVWSGGAQTDAVCALSRIRHRLHPRLPLSVPTIVNTGSGVGGADHLGFPAEQHRRSDVARWVRSQRGGSLVLSNLDAATTATIGEPHVTLERSVCPRRPIGPEHPIGRSSGYRRQVRAKLRKAGEAGATFRYVAPESFQPDLLEVLMSLHERRWDEREGESSFVRARLPLHRALVGYGAPGRGPAAVVAIDGAGATIGVVYGFVWDDTFSFFQSGWDPDWAHLGLGTVVHAAAFDLLAEAGIQTYDFLRGAEEYKYRFGATDLVDTSLLVPRGVGGLALRWKQGVRSSRSAETVPDAEPSSDADRRD